MSRFSNVMVSNIFSFIIAGIAGAFLTLFLFFPQWWVLGLVSILWIVICIFVFFFVPRFYEQKKYFSLIVSFFFACFIYISVVEYVSLRIALLILCIGCISLFLIGTSIIKKLVYLYKSLRRFAIMMWTFIVAALATGLYALEIFFQG